MKKFISLFIIALLTLTISACSGNKNSSLTLMNTAKTDLVEFTLDRADLAIALENTWGDDYYLPKEYENSDSGNPFVADVGHTLVPITFTLKNLNRSSTDLFGFTNNEKFSVEYNGKNYKSEIKFGTEENEKEGFKEYKSSNILLNANEVSTYRGYLDIDCEIKDLNSDFSIVVTLPNSQGKTEEFVFSVTEADRKTAITKAEADLQAKKDKKKAEIDALLTEIDPAIANAVKNKLQGTWSFNSYGSKIEYIFEGDRYQVIGTIQGSRYQTSAGTFSVRSKAILCTSDSGGTPSYITYTYENGNVELTSAMDFIEE